MVTKLSNLKHWILCQAERAKKLRDSNRSEEASTLLQECLALKSVMGPDNPTMSIVVAELGRAYQDLGQNEDAEACYREALAAQERVVGRDHHDTIATANHLGLVLRLQDKFEEAGVLYQRVIDFASTSLGKDHMDTISALINYAGCLADQGCWEKALPLFKTALEKREASLGYDNPRTINSRINMALAWMHLPKEKEGNETLRAEGRATMAQARDDLINRCKKTDNHPWILKCDKYIILYDNGET